MGPSPLDIWASRHTAQMIEEAGKREKTLKGKLLICRKIPQTRVGREAREALNVLGLEIFETEICQRIAYVESMLSGVSVLQYAAAGEAAREVESLPREQRLIESNEYEVYFAASDQAPRVLQEIGRLREETFRAAGEGTGKAVDLDRFDNIYTHLFVWNREKHEVVGAYRLGATDRILEKYGKKGLYTHTLFKYQDRFLREEMGPALEMGRTFVRKEYQRSYSPLLLLWKGIGQYVAAYPVYRILFGAVSISNDYHSYSRRLLVAFLHMTRSRSDFGKMVTPRNPFRKKQVKGLHWVGEEGDEGLDELSAWISGIEEDGKGVPILLKQYLKLGGKVLSFNVDRRFRNALDGLILVDLALTDHKILKKYMGEEGFKAFMRHHRAQRLPARFARS